MKEITALKCESNLQEGETVKTQKSIRTRYVDDTAGPRWKDLMKSTRRSPAARSAEASGLVDDEDS